MPLSFGSSNDYQMTEVAEIERLNESKCPFGQNQKALGKVPQQHMSTVSKVSKRARKVAVTVAAHPLVTKGFTAAAARRWVRSQARDIASVGSGTEFKEVRELHRSGEVRRTAEATQASGDRLSYKEFLYLTPLNRKAAWLTNRVTAFRFVEGLEKFLRTPICTVFTWRDSFDIVRLQDFPENVAANAEGLLEVVRSRGAVQILPVRWDRGNGRQITFDGIDYAIDGWPATAEEVLKVIAKMSSGNRCVLLPYEDVSGHTGSMFDDASGVLRLFIGRSDDGRAQILQAQYCSEDQWRVTIPAETDIEEAQNEGLRRGWDKRRQRLSLGEQRYAKTTDVDVSTGEFINNGGVQTKFPKFEAIAGELEELFSNDRHDFTFISIDVGLSLGTDFEVVDLSISPRFPVPSGFNTATEAFLRNVLEQRRESKESRGQRKTIGSRTSRRTQKMGRQFQTFQLRAQGYTGRAARLWVRRMSNTKNQSAGTPNSATTLALEWGFDPTFVSRFGVTEENRTQFVSLRDYLFVQPLNGKYSKWVRDRISARSVFKPFLSSFEPLHYQVLRRDRELQIIALSEEARTHGTDMEGLAASLTEHGALTLSSSAWSGSVSREVSYDGKFFIVDEVSYTADEFEKLLTFRVRDQFFVLGEVLKDSSPLTSLSSTGDVHLQITMLNPNGTSPQVAEAFVVASENADEHHEAFVTKGLKLGRGGKTLGKLTGVIRDEEFIEMQLAEAEQRSDSEDPGPGYRGDDIRVEDDIDEAQVANYRLVCQLDPTTGSIEAGRSLVNGTLRVYATHPVTEELISRSIPEWESVVKLLEKLCHFAPQLRFVEFSVVLTEEGPIVNGISATPSYGQEYVFSEATVKFLQREQEEKQEKSSPVKTVVAKWLHQAKLKTRREFASALYPEGLVPYQSVRWLGDMRRDLFERNGIDLKTKLWAYKNGFLSYRIPQYGITEENRHEFISDFEYRWLRHINKKYKYWLEDKISIKYVAAEFNDCLPAYYFYTTAHEGQNTVVPMMDCPEGFGSSFEDVLRLAQEKSVVALKPDEGSHGDGFYRLDHGADGYALNGQPASEAEVLAILQDTKNQYLVTEFIQMHPVLAEIYPHSVNTIRLLVFKKDGVTPEIGNAYLRVGSVKSGYVDNTAAGGMLAQIDAATGKFGNAQILENGRVTDCPRHPDTGVLIDGVIPHWDYAIKKVLDISASLPQLEYLGFDLAITPDGIMLPEINRSPDFPRIDKLTPDTIDYLLYKLDRKKRLYGYDEKPPKKLISLPRRAQ